MDKNRLKVICKIKRFYERKAVSFKVTNEMLNISIGLHADDFLTNHSTVRIDYTYHDPLKHKLPVQILEVTENQTELNIIMKCKHEWVMPEDSFELPYCKHCYKGA
jgi:hypothetical protein